ncbi:hypothetical protein HDV00_007131 [Rhizophlyctis rosea]|nr:hypothetical protein HDV00_007131 [Rhizophlyctis rosea]
MSWGPARIILNILRVLSIISLLLVIASSVAVNYYVWPKIGQSNTVFQFANRIIIAVVCLILVLAEIERPKFILKHFEIVSRHKSWTGMGWIQLCAGSFILGYDSIITSISTQANLYYLVLVPGWFLFLIGWIYVLLGLIGGMKLRAMRRGETYNPDAETESYKHDIYKHDTLPRSSPPTLPTYSLPRPPMTYAASVSSWSPLNKEREDDVVSVASTVPPMPPPRTRSGGMKETVRSNYAPSTYSESVYGSYM